MIFLFLMVRVLYPLWTLYISLRHLSLTVSTSPFLVVSADQYLVFQWVLNVFSSSQTLLQRAILVERNRDQKPRRETSGASNVLDLLFFAWKIMGISCNKSWSMVGYDGISMYIYVYMYVYIYTQHCTATNMVIWVCIPPPVWYVCFSRNGYTLNPPVNHNFACDFMAILIGAKPQV